MDSPHKPHRRIELKHPRGLEIGAHFFGRDGHIYRVELSNSGLCANSGPWFLSIESEKSEVLESALNDWIEAYSEGKNGDLPYLVDSKHRALEALLSIPFGQVRSYKEFSLLIDKPKAWRYAGSLLGSNPLPLILPCHRIIRSDGNLGGFMGSSTEGILIKKKILLFEARKNCCQRVQ